MSKSAHLDAAKVSHISPGSRSDKYQPSKQPSNTTSLRSSVSSDAFATE
jgi:hypothetical protein